MIDSHTHVHDAAFDADRDAVMERARAAGIEAFVTVGCDLKDSARAVATAKRYGIAASAGIHPHEAKDAPADVAAALEPLLEDRTVVAVGETGLDFYYDHSPREAQERVLRSQLAVARARSLPLIFHVRDAHARMMEILREERWQTLRGVVHCFTGDTREAEAYVHEFGLLLGIGGVLTFKTAAALRDAAAAVSIGSLLLETDAPYLAPVPHRGERNEPAFMRHTAEQLAQCLDLAPSDVIRCTNENARSLFAFP